MGGYLVNYFNRFGRQWQVYLEAEGDYRVNASNIGQFYVTNPNGDRVPLSTLANIRSITGPEFLMRYNEYNGGAGQRHRRSGDQLGTGHESHGRSVRSNHAARDGL